LKSSRSNKRGFGNTSNENYTENSLKFNNEFNQEKEALGFIKEGKFKEAEEIYKKLIELGTKNHKIYGNLATLNGIKGNKNEMYKLLKKAIEIEPNYPEAHNNLGSYYRNEGNYDLAILEYKYAIRIKKDYFDPYYNIGNTFISKSDFSSALYFLEEGLKLKENDCNSLNSIGIALKAKGDIISSIKYFKKALEINNKSPKIINNLGTTYHLLGNLDLAKNCFKSALEINSSFPEAHSNLGLIFQEKGNYESAIKSFQRALMIRSDFPDAINNLAITFMYKEDLNNALTYFKKAIEIKPNFPNAYFNLGNLFEKKGDLEKAILYFNKAIQLNPSFSDCYNNLGNTFREKGNIISSIDSYHKALAIAPDNANIIFNLSFVQLLSGDFKSGWKNYESRITKTDPIPIYGNPKCEKFNGIDLSEISLLLVVCEQGLGDTIQFMRYIPYLKNKKLEIRFSAQEKLHPLIKQSNIEPNPLTPDQASSVSNGYWIPLLSLPKYLGIDASLPLVTEPYISTSDDLKYKWKNILSKEKKTIIGINWQGNPATEQNNLKGRSLKLELFSFIAEKNVRLLSLQKGFGTEQLKTCSFLEKFVESQNQVNKVWDFDETVAMIDSCDLIITSDTVTAHLAGGMGKPTWVLLTAIPDWRWGLQSDKTFWYPSMRLFRQSEVGNWIGVMRRVSLELDNLLSQKDRISN